MVITKKGGNVSKVASIRTELANSLVKDGMNAELYIVVCSRPPSLAQLAELDGSMLVARASITQKTGEIIYNFGAKSPVGELNGRLQGNYFTGAVVDPKTLTEYQAAKEEQVMERELAKATK